MNEYWYILTNIYLTIRRLGFLGTNIRGEKRNVRERERKKYQRERERENSEMK